MDQECKTRSRGCGNLGLKFASEVYQKFQAYPILLLPGVLGRLGWGLKDPQGLGPLAQKRLPYLWRAVKGMGGGVARRGREVLGALNSEKTSHAGELQDPALESQNQELEPLRSPRPSPACRPIPLQAAGIPAVLGTPPLCREEKGRGPRAQLRLLGPLPVAGAPPQPAWGPPPLLLYSELPSPARDNGFAV